MIPICYQVISVISDRELNNSYNSMMNSLNILESQINSLENILNRAYINDNLTRINLITSEKEPRDYYAMLKAQQHIASIAASNSCIVDIIVSFRSNDIVLTKHTSFDNLFAFNRYYSIKDSEDISLYDDISPFPGGSFEYLPVTNISFSAPSTNTNRPVEAFCYVLPLRLSNVPQKNGVAYIFIDKNHVLDTALPQSLRDNSFFQILDEDNDIILDYNDVPQALEYRDMKHYRTKFDGARYFIVNAKNSDGTLKMIVGIPTETFVKSIQNIFILIAFYILLLVLLGVLVSICIASRQSAPLQQLLKNLDTYAHVGRQQYKNEFDLINSSIIDMKSDRERILRKLEQNQKTLNSNMIERLLCSGQLTNRQYSEILTSLKNFPKAFIVCYGKVQPQTQAERNELEVLTVLAIERIKKFLPQSTIFHSLSENTFAVLLSIEGKIDYIQILDDMLNKVNLGESIEITLAISDPQSGIANVNIAFEQARFVFTLAKSKKSLLTKEDIVHAHNSTYEIKDYIGLYNCIASADSFATVKYIHRMFKAADLSLADMEQLYYMVRMTLIFAARDYVDSEDQISTIPKYQHLQSPNQMIETLCNIGDDICNIINQNKRSQNIELKENILNYIHNNFTDSDMYAEQISAKFEISEKYLFNFIKEQTGYSLGDYIESLRLEYATELLHSELDRNITSISQECGYTSYNTFYKAFRRNYSISPSKYRDNSIENQNVVT